MHFIVFDLEFNQDFDSLCISTEKASQCPFEIIQIGAIKIDANFNEVATFNRFVKPSIYMKISPFITELTGISTDQILSKEPFPNVFDDFIRFIGEDQVVFCVWGMSDMKELYRNAKYHNLNKNRLPDMFINIQPYVTAFLKLPDKKLLSLQTATETLHILTPYKFHNALFDSYYTTEIFKKIYSSAIEPIQYRPEYITIRRKQPKKIIDFEKLIQQFEKMYARKLNSEEQDMIKLAYKMGKTNQFVKYEAD